MATQVSVAVNVKVSIEEFNQLLGIYIGLQKKSAALVVQNTGRLFCKDMLGYTPPFSGSGPSSQGRSGMDSIARNKGRSNVNRDVRKIFAPIAQAPADEVAAFGNLGIFSAWMKAKRELPEPHEPYWVFKRFKTGAFIGQGEWDLFQEWTKNGGGKRRATFVMGTTESSVKALHEAIRGRPQYRVSKNFDSKEKVFVDDWKVVERYIKKVQQRVGRLKSGWYYAGRALGKMPRVEWVEAQGGQDKICLVNLKGSTPTVRVGSQGKERFGPWYSLMRSALNHRAYVMRLQMLRWLKDPRNHGTLRQVIARMPQGFNLIETKD